MNTTGTGVDELWNELIELVNIQFDTPPFRRLLEIPFTRERAQRYSIQMAHYVKNRRDCWGYVQGAAPLDVKRMIWEHEHEELMGDPSKGKADHITLAVREGEVFGLSADDFERVRPLDGAVACFYAWTLLAKDRPWLEAIAASAILELRNSDELVRGGSLSYRIGKNLERDVGIPLKRQINNAEHVVADIAHGHLLLEVARAHVHSADAQRAILRGARESLVIDRVFRQHLADMMESLP